MRLLHFDKAGKLLLADFGGKTVPPYAILSHRWGTSEVLFEDIANSSYDQKKGYRKIEFCAEKVAKDQLQYFWIDTCCINKWDLNELSVSINSMFRWYKDAKTCYVFLADVSAPTAATAAQQSSWETSFRTSEWFCRGWTLQELIAPKSVEFFSLEGQRIGDKRSLAQLVYEISNIPIEALQGCSLDRFTIPERIEWTENRETTEEEDIVYCLLGILDISMPASYGEGREKAQLRLEAQMASSAPFMIPFCRNDSFVGRESQLAELEARLFRSKRPTFVAIEGPRGIGKSQLALELAYRIRQQNKNYCVLWIDASSIGGLHQSYATIAQKLKIPGWDDNKTDIKQIIKRYLSRKDVGQSLLIFDNADNADSMFAESHTRQGANLMEYLPQSEFCSILFTTAYSDQARVLACQEIIELQEMEQDMAQSMLERYLSTPLSRNQQSQAKLLLQELSHLPLAIVQAAAYINNTHITLQEYRIRLAKQRRTDLESYSEVLEDKLEDSDREGPVVTTLHLSINQIRHDSPLAASYLFLAACVNRKDILLEFLRASSHREREEAIRIINCYNLVTRRPADSSLDLHQLVHTAVRGWLQKQMILEEWTTKAVIQLSRVFPDDRHGNRSKWRRMLPHAKYTLSHRARSQEGRETMTLVWNYAEALLSDGQYGESERLFIQAMDTFQKILGDEHSDTLNSMDRLAITFCHQNRWKEAEGLEVQVVQTRKRVFGDDHPDTLTSMNNLALAYKGQGRLKEAEQLEVQVTNIRKRVLGGEHPHTLTSIANLAATCSEQGRWEEAEQMNLQVLEIRKRVLGDEHPETLTSKANLATIYWFQRRWKEAEQMDLQVLETRKRVLGDEHPDTLTSIANLGLTYEKQSQ